MNRELVKKVAQLSRKASDSAYSDQIGTGDSNNFIRWHIYRGSIEVVDLTNAGKRGKMCPEATLYDIDFVRNGDTLTAVDQLVESLPGANYQQVLVAFRKIAEMDPRAKVAEHLHKGVTVIPANLKPVVLDTKEFYLKATPREFTVYDKRDRNNEPALMQTNTQSAQAFYRLLQESDVTNLTFSQIWNFMSQHGIRPHHWCRMD